MEICKYDGILDCEKWINTDENQQQKTKKALLSGTLPSKLIEK